MIDDIQKVVEPTINSLGFELVDIDFKREQQGMVLRFYIDRVDGKITLDDCAKISERISFLLDKADIIQERYVLEVSSPGICRRLKKESDFEKYKGSRVSLKVYQPIQAQKNFVGVIESVKSGKLLLNVNSKIVEIEIPNIAKANLAPEIKI